MRVCDPEAASWVMKIHRAAERAEREQTELERVIAAARADGASWTVVGTGLGQHRGTAHRKWGPRVARRNGSSRA